ncbi:hypothetical protein GLW08_16400 [Pontibacillus yanchengensis]|uniref:Uncharacterized protein n=1 Tax=Pontibacillus yanchengensis TaxID=462910 RepID=A0ACC7VJH1_9BACI|nr:hypothetical protein [Pontibacillus yanchengensis]
MHDKNHRDILLYVALRAAAKTKHFKKAEKTLKKLLTKHLKKWYIGKCRANDGGKKNSNREKMNNKKLLT